MNDEYGKSYIASVFRQASEAYGRMIDAFVLGHHFGDAELIRRARRYAVLNRNIWWNRPALHRVVAVNDLDAIDQLTAPPEGR